MKTKYRNTFTLFYSQLLNFILHLNFELQTVKKTESFKLIDGIIGWSTFAFIKIDLNLIISMEKVSYIPLQFKNSPIIRNLVFLNFILKFTNLKNFPSFLSSGSTNLYSFKMEGKRSVSHSVFFMGNQQD